MINGSFADNIGLLAGKMGIVVFFYHYSRYTNDVIYEKFAGELLNEIYEDIHSDTPIGFSDGLCGIAWGILHLIENDFVDADPNEVLKDIDQTIMRQDVRRIADESLDTGLLGIAYYFFQRKNTDKIYLHELTENMKSHHLEIFVQNSLLGKIIEDIEINDEAFKQKKPSLSIEKNGIAGMGLKLLWNKDGKN
jgi:lantibiotic modifying enzyme